MHILQNCSNLTCNGEESKGTRSKYVRLTEKATAGILWLIERVVKSKNKFDWHLYTNGGYC